MTEVTIEVDDVQEFIVQKVTDGEADVEAVAQNVFDDALWGIYQSWKAAESDEDIVPSGDPEDES